MNKAQFLIAVTFSALLMPVSAHLWVHAAVPTPFKHYVPARAWLKATTSNAPDTNATDDPCTRQPCIVAQVDSRHTDKHGLSDDGASAEHSIRCDTVTPAK